MLLCTLLLFVVGVSTFASDLKDSVSSSMTGVSDELFNQILALSPWTVAVMVLIYGLNYLFKHTVGKGKSIPSVILLYAKGFFSKE
ncbi:hypothetical protein [Flammeovirga agarivorans]|uniref:Uncharacterized protein n=1 Tax=Flammeovirga agarivorans TaxID=2726742 RepID=A0A7X8XZD8_9BACT|nr:hypothetical protein [Flammeovirga agarivorans]NLR94953.1 hypothetical protein [Flammeovirga agarivorans]